ncbi:MAG: PEGA domain-containing protein [Patescibacteria group bacterium]
MKKIFYMAAIFLLAVILFGVVLFIISKNKEKGALQVTSDPKSKVYVNGKQIGQTPFRTSELKDMFETGDYIVKLVPISGNFSPFEQKITISPKVLTVIDRNFGPTGLENGSIISLKEISDKKDAQISIVSFPDSAQVFLDNNLGGQTPMLLKNITESDHEIRLSKEGYKDKISLIKTVLGYRLEILVFMGINPNVASASSAINSSASASISLFAKVLILATPTGFLRVREDASLKALEVSRVKPGETYDLLEEKDNWYKIKIDDKTSGWISKQYAKKS